MLLSKHHGLGNDFLILLDDAESDAPARVPDSALARRLCDRHLGLGADGLIWGRIPAATDPSCDVVFQLWNSDGSDAEVSGNGLRCLAHGVARAQGRPATSLRIGTVAGVRTAEVVPTEDPCTADVEVEMGPISAGVEIPAAARSVLATDTATASVGNPHLVVRVDDVGAIDLATVGPRLESHFAGGINVEFIAPGGADTIDLVVWERGSGITRACGSGATAAAWVAQGWGLVGEQAEVRMPGGTATVTLSAEGARLRGPATYVAAIEVPDA